MVDILRVSTFPTKERPGMGLHPFYLCGSSEFKTVFLAPTAGKEERLEIPDHTELIEADFVGIPRPKRAGKMKKLVFNLSRLFHILSFSFSGLKVLLTRHVDVVHIHSPMFWILGFFAWVSGKKVCITFHGTDFHRIKGSRLYRRGAFIFDLVFIISPDMKAVLESIHGPSKVITTFNGVDVSRFTNYASKRKCKVIAVGSLKEEKGFEHLISGFASLLNNNSSLYNYELSIVGEGQLRDVLEAQIARLGMDERIFLIGQKGQEDLVKIYNESEIFVLSSVSEGFPKVLLEAMACGCKVVATKVGCVESILPEYRFLSDPNDPSDLAASLLKCITDFDYVVDGGMLKQVVSEHTWPRVQQQYIEYYKGIL